jgi:hypothetical protein
MAAFEPQVAGLDGATGFFGDDRDRHLVVLSSSCGQVTLSVVSTRRRLYRSLLTRDDFVLLRAGGGGGASWHALFQRVTDCLAAGAVELVQARGIQGTHTIRLLPKDDSEHEVGAWMGSPKQKLKIEKM